MTVETSVGNYMHETHLRPYSVVTGLPFTFFQQASSYGSFISTLPYGCGILEYDDVSGKILPKVRRNVSLLPSRLNSANRWFSRNINNLSPDHRTSGITKPKS